MRNLLEMIYEFQLLRAKKEHLDVPLDDDERARLLGLGQLLTNDGDRGARAMPRMPFPTQVSFTQPGGFESGDVKNLSGKGLAIATARPPLVGTRVLLRLVDEQAGREYFFPCRVVWSRRSPLPGMGVAFDGVPTKSEYVESEDTGVWKRTFVIGDPRKDVQAA
jgi:hypothetical protein